MTDFDKRDRGQDISQRFTRVRPVAFEGTHELAHREGGNKPLPVIETKPGVFLSGWMIEAKHCQEFFDQVKKDGRSVILSLVVDTNVPGHPTISMQLQEIFLD